MRILQLTSDWKWTGPAEPMLRLGLALRERGHAVALACPEAPNSAQRSLADEARAVGLAPRLTLSRGRESSWFGARSDIGALRDFLEAEAIDIVHTWHTHDHLLALRAAHTRRAQRKLKLVRSYRNAQHIPMLPWNRILFGSGCDGLICVSPETARRNAAIRGGRPVIGVFGAVDLARFVPKPRSLETMRDLGLLPEHQVVGIVARVQPHRRFDLLLDACELLFRKNAQARLLVIGRGTRRAELLDQPARARGIADRLLLAGYRNQDFADVLRCIDVFTFLVPGSDGTCRALLEAAACGIPAVTSARGALPEIVEHGTTGLIVPETPQALAEAWQRLLTDVSLRTQLGDAAQRRAAQLFAPQHYAQSVENFYETLVG